MKSFWFGSAAVLGLAVVAAGCASTSGAVGEAPAAPPMSKGAGMMGAMCPMHVAGTTVAFAEVEGGAALTFTTTGDIDELQRRVQGMAQMHDRRHTAGEKGDANEGGMHGGMMMGGGMKMPPAVASAENTAGGARLVLKPADSAHLAAVRQHTRMMADRMARGDCSMMSGTAVPPSTGDESHAAHHAPAGEVGAQ